MKKGGYPIRLQKHLKIGAISAENDDLFLSECFIDTGDYSSLVDTECDASIILGRTGSGKSALLEMVKKKEDNVIEVFPEELALNYISHSNIIILLEECGVSLDPFYQLLWKHIFVVELIRYKYDIGDESALKATLESFSSLFKKDRVKKTALEYLTKWQDKFWLPVEDRVKEITTKIETQLTKSLGIGGKFQGKIQDLLSSGLSAAARREKLSTLSKEEKEEIRNRVRSAVDSVQIQELHQVIKLLGENLLDNKQERFYIVIDKIDENWVEDKTRYRLIRALIDTIKTFRRVRTVKFLLALRVDLLQTVFNKTRSAGYQEDKLRDYILELRWNNADLKALLERRVAYMFRRQYEKVDAKLSDLFPVHVGSTNALDWLMSRTLMRPRDLIVYVNFCLDRAAGNKGITSSNIRDMEVSYSQERLNAVCQEWIGEFPALEQSLEVLKNKKNGFTHSEITKDQIDKLAEDILLLDLPDGGEIYRLVCSYLNKEISRASFINCIITIFYLVGLIGIKRDGHESAIWSYADSAFVTEAEVKRSSHFYIHPMFWRALGIHVDKKIKGSGGF